MAFWGVKLVPGKSTPYVPPPEAVNLHLSQAAVPPNAPEGRRVSVVMKIGGSDAEEDSSVIICTLNPGRLDSVPLDLFLDKYAEFELQGANTEVHLTGYFTPPDEGIAHMGEDDDDEDFDPDEEGGPAFPLGFGVDDDDDDDENDEDEDEDDEGEDEDSEEGEPGVTRHPQVTIKEINGDDDEEEEEEKPAPAKGKQQPQQLAGSKRPAEDKKQQQAPNKKQQQQQGQKQQQQQHKDQEQKKQEQPKADATAAGEIKTGKKNIRTWENGFSIEELAMGEPSGRLAKGGKTVMVRYIGRLKSNGKVFDQTKGSSTFKFRLGAGEVIKGWDKGVEGMRVGDKRRLVIPPQLAYGPEGVKGAIPPNATLEFDVELVNVK